MIWRLLLHGVVATNIRGKISALINEQHLVYEVLQMGVWWGLSLWRCLSLCPLAWVCFKVATKGIWVDMDLPSVLGNVLVSPKPPPLSVVVRVKVNGSHWTLNVCHLLVSHVLPHNVIIAPLFKDKWYKQLQCFFIIESPPSTLSHFL